VTRRTVTRRTVTRLFATRLFARRRPEQPSPAAEPELTELPLDPPDELAILIADSPRIAPSPQPVSLATAATVCVAAGLAFGLLTAWVVRRGTAVPAVDEHLHRWVLAHRGPASAAVARAIRWGGVSWIVLPALVPIGAASAGAGASAGAEAGAGRGLNRRLGSGLLLCLIASTGVYAETRINAAVGRVRPPMSDWAGAAAGPSFPSGHTTNATLFALCCAWAVAARVPRGWPRQAVWAAAAAYAATVGWSRVWLGVHWPTDVLGAWLFDAAWFAGSVTVIIVVGRRRYTVHGGR
jgi:membrane-associated phospholipid phosphatase